MTSLKAYRLVEDLQKEGYDVLLTGGLAVEAWSNQKFSTGDWDLVGGPDADFDAIHEALRDRGYEKRGKSWVQPHYDSSLPPQNAGEFFTTQYLWDKTINTTLRFPSETVTVECIAPEWLFVNRARKTWDGMKWYAEQALFIREKFIKAPDYQWDTEFIENVADRLQCPDEARNPDWLHTIARDQNSQSEGPSNIENESDSGSSGFTQ